jgi:hypothetical protein
MGQALAHRGGIDPKFGHDNMDELVVFKPREEMNGRFVNVDTTIKDGILRAKELGLVQSHISDIIFTMEPTFAGTRDVAAVMILYFYWSLTSSFSPLQYR